jgi:acyl-CoA reductase-like NAD-dependent aldehyde dehydrogenase
MPREITEAERELVANLVARARHSMRAIEHYDQAQVDRLCQAVGWATANEETFQRLSDMGVDESGLGDRQGRPNKRFKIMGILRDALRQKSVGVIEDIPEKGIVKYAKAAGVIASIVPVTNAGLTEPGNSIYALKCRDAIVFSPHPASKKTSMETVRIMRDALTHCGAPPDLIQGIENPSIPLAHQLMASCDLTIATGGSAMVKAAYSSGKPAYGVGAGNATMIIDETADVPDAARNTRLSKTSDNGSGCSADGNLLVDARTYDRFLEQLQKEGGYLVSDGEKKKLQHVMWDAQGHRTSPTIARPARRIAELAGFSIPDGKTFLIVKEENIGAQYPFSSEKLSPVLAIFRYSGFDDALSMVEKIYEVGGKGHSCGIYSFDDEHIHRLAMMAPVSRIMVRQPQSKANAGAFNNGMPMTSSMGCGTWGGNITSENIALRHYMNVTWVSRPIAEDRPSEQELFGEFYGAKAFA